MSSNRIAGSFWVLISVFFFWGFVASSNTILIPIFKKQFHLMQWQSQMVDFAFYVAYAIGSLVYFLTSITKGDPLNKIGYRNGLITGLLISAVGALGFIPAAMLHSFPLMLGSLFVVGLGFALQQIVANPYVIALGTPETGSHRVSLAGGINSFGTTIGPLLIGFAIFGSIHNTSDAVSLDTVKMPYLVLSVAFVLFAVLLGISGLPAVKNEEKIERDLGAFKYPQLIYGMVAIFMYVGVEVTIQSNLPELMRQSNILGLESKFTVHFISLYWGSLMIGRWTGATAAFNPTGNNKHLLKLIAPIAAYAVIILVNYVKGSPINDLLYYAPCVALLIFGFFITNDKPARTMTVFGLAAAIMVLVGLLTEGRFALYAFISAGLFCSVMWPCIFSLSIAGLGKYTNQGSSLLIMMILGGAIIPPLQGFTADFVGKLQKAGMDLPFNGIHISYIIPVVCFSYLAFFGFKVNSILKKQNIHYD